MTKNNHDQESLLEKVQFSSTGAENQTQPNGDSENKAEGLVHPPAATFNSHRLRSADSLLEEEKAMILSPADVATNDILHLQDHNVLSDNQETTGSPLQVVGLEKVGKTNIVPAELSHTVLIEKHPKSLPRLHKKISLAADLQTKGGKSLTKQPSSPFRAADHFPTSRKKMYSPSLVQVWPTTALKYCWFISMPDSKIILVLGLLLCCLWACHHAKASRWSQLIF